MPVFKFRQSELEHVRSLLKAALGPLFDPEYDNDDGGIEAIIDWAAGAGCTIEEAVTAEANAAKVTAHLNRMQWNHFRERAAATEDCRMLFQMLPRGISGRIFVEQNSD
jgi:hypothetical protein